MNISEALTAHNLIKSLEISDPARDSVAERHDAARAEVDRYLYGLPDWQQLLAPRLGEVMAITERIAGESRTANASDPSDELPYGAIVASDLAPVTVAPPYTPDPPGPCPVGLFRSNLNGEPTIERHYAYGSRTLSDIADDAVEAARTERGCDLRMITPSGLHDSVTYKSSRFVWPIGRGEYVVFLRYCSECLGALFAKYGVGKCEISQPWRIG